MRLRPPLLARILVAAAGVALATAGAAPAAAQTSNLSADEQIVLFPTEAALDVERGVWTVPVHAHVFEPERDSVARRALLTTLAATLRLPADSDRSQLFQERASAFLVDNERSKNVAVRIAGQLVRLEETDENGHARGSIELPAALVEQSTQGTGWLEATVILLPGDTRRYTGRIRCLPASGLLVVSDIDDTIKLSDVNDRSALLSRTFLEPFVAVKGMSALYTGWAANPGVDFHYLTASPWQLHAPLQDFLAEGGFPGGPITMRDFRFKDETLFELFKSSADYKLEALARLGLEHPERRLVLVGDSGEQDPEIFGRVARQWPDRLAFILIRDVTDEARESPRYERAFEDVPMTRWTIFKTAEDVTDLLMSPEATVLR